MPLKDVTLYLTEVHSGNIRFDLSRLSAAAKARSDLPGPDSPVTFTLRSITLQNAVAAILDSLGCKASLHGETLVVEPQ
jgi:hypothetical protein